jgi:hypothetical protein
MIERIAIGLFTITAVSQVSPAADWLSLGNAPPGTPALPI